MNWVIEILIPLVILLPFCTTLSLLDLRRMTPCKFNPLCLCSSSGEDLGAVECSGVDLPSIPQQLQESRVSALRLSANFLRSLPDKQFKYMGCWSLEISNNDLTSLPPDAFSGLERTVWELVLSRNYFQVIPTESFQNLQKLNLLDLSDNQIMELSSDDVNKLPPTLETLSLAGNSLNSVPEGIFNNFVHLQTLDLSRNQIINIHSMAFAAGTPELINLNLADNLLSKIPFSAIKEIKNLKTLDLSSNRIADIPALFFQGSLRLDRLLLRDNQIGSLARTTFRNFKWLNFTSLSGNKINMIENEAFRGTEIRHLELSNCDIGSILPGAFRGLERSLQELDLSNNRLTVLPPTILESFEAIRKIDLTNNVLAISPNYTLSDSRFSILDMSLEGPHMRYIHREEIGLLRNLRRLAMPTISPYGSLTLDLFVNYPPGLEILNLVGAEIKYITSNAFYHIPSISYLDLSGNQIEDIAEKSFKEIGNSLKHLRMRHALHFEHLPSEPFQDLVAITILDLSNNYIQSMPVDTFYKMKNLRELYLQDNELKSLVQGTLHSQANPNLEILDLSFNHLSKIDPDVFRFEKLEILKLNDNRIKTLDKRSFIDMKSLKYLNLEGNHIQIISDEAFQNLHNLRVISLAYNKLRSVNLDSFDNVGSLTSLQLDLSNNNIQTLSSNKTITYSSNSRIRSLNLSNNNITSIDQSFFEPLASLLKNLQLKNNKLSKITKENIGCLRKLMVLDVSNNQIDSIEENSLSSMKDLQQLDLSDNNLNSLQPKLFSQQPYLHTVDLSDNNLNILPEAIFQGTILGTLKVASNNLQEIPVKALNPVQSTLKHLHLSYNNISIISESQLSQVRNLVTLDLSSNNIGQIDDRGFCCLPSLLDLSLANNPLQMLSDTILEGLSPQLESLNLANASINLLPFLNLPNILRLNISSNKLTFLPSSALGEMKKMRSIDLSGNSMPTPPHNLWFILPLLTTLYLGDNPITTIRNDSFLSLDNLEVLDLSHMDIDSIEDSSLANLPNLKKLTISVVDGKLGDLVSLLTFNPALNHLVLETGAGANLKKELRENLPSKLQEITLRGEKIDKLFPAALQSVTSRVLKLNIESGQADISREIFLNLGAAENLTIDLSGHYGNRSDGVMKVSSPVSTYRIGTPNSVYLDRIILSDKKFDCSCSSMGWFGKWLRYWRGNMCNHITGPEECDHYIRDLREARCQYSDKRLLESLKDLECLSYSASNIYLSSFTVILLANLVKNMLS